MGFHEGVPAGESLIKINDILGLRYFREGNSYVES